MLQESSSDEEETKDLLKAPSGCWRPQLNFSWNIILDQVLPSPNSKVTKGSFQDFYRIVVDGMQVLSNGVMQSNRLYRNTVFFDIICQPEILGFSIFPKGVEESRPGKHAHAVYKEFYAYLDQPSFEEG